MCMTCFALYTDKPVINDQVREAFALIQRVKESGHELSSSPLLHVIIGDMNVDDRFFDLNLFTPPADPLEQKVFEALAELTVPERATVVAMTWGYFDADGNRVNGED